MAEAKLMAEFEQHDKVEACNLAAVGLFALGLSFAVRELTDGFIPAVWAESKTREPAGGSAAQQLVDEGLWEPVEGGYRVHDFAVYNPTRAAIEDRRRRERERKRAQRERRGSGVPVGQVVPVGRPAGTARVGADDRHADAVSPVAALAAGPQGEARGGGLGGGTTTLISQHSSGDSAQQNGSHTLVNGSTESPNGASATSKADERDREWSDWLDHFRAATEKPHTRGSRIARRAFNARRDDGFSVDDLKLATEGCHGDHWCRANGFDRPETILRESKVERYVAIGRRLRSGEVIRAPEPEHPASRRIRERSRSALGATS